MLLLCILLQTTNTGSMKINIHQANATFKICGQILDGEAELIQGGLDMRHRKTQEPEMARQDSLPAQEVTRKRQQ